MKHTTKKSLGEVICLNDLDNNPRLTCDLKGQKLMHETHLKNTYLIN